MMPDLVTVLETAAAAGVPSIIVTSQRGVAKGLMTSEELDDIHDRLQAGLKESGVSFLDIYACTHTEADRHWAKPNPDMIFEAARKHSLDLSKSIIIGDADRDIQMGRNAGLGVTIRLRGEKPIGIEADYNCSNLLEFNELLPELFPVGK